MLLIILQQITGIIIPKGVTIIGYSAFDGCTSLASITIPKSVNEIGMLAFRGTSWLDQKLNKSPMVVVNDILIQGWASGKGTIPKGVKIIGQGAFNDCTGLKSITISAGVAEIGEYAFARCTNLEKIIIPKSVNKIGAGAFYDTIWLEQRIKKDPLVIANNIVIDGHMVSGKITIPKNVRVIADNTFEDNTNLGGIRLQKGLIEIGERAFYGCKNLTNIIMPQGFKKIGKYAFAPVQVWEILQYQRKSQR